MPLKTRTKITIETERLLVRGRTRSAFNAWCPVCGELGRLLPPDEAAAALTACLQLSKHPVEISKLHIIPAADGLLSVCFNSLLNQSQART